MEPKPGQIEVLTASLRSPNGSPIRASVHPTASYGSILFLTSTASLYLTDESELWHIQPFSFMYGSILRIMDLGTQEPDVLFYGYVVG